MLNKRKQIFYLALKFFLLITLVSVSKYNYIVRYITIIVISLVISTTIHELNHFIAFKLCGIKVIAITIGMFTISNKKMKLNNSKILSGCCDFEYDEKIPKKKYYYSLLAGGFNNFIFGVLGIVLIFIIPAIKPSIIIFIPMLIMIIDGVYNCAYRNSSDRKIIKRIRNAE